MGLVICIWFGNGTSHTSGLRMGLVICIWFGNGTSHASGLGMGLVICIWFGNGTGHAFGFKISHVAILNRNRILHVTEFDVLSAEGPVRAGLICAS